MITREEAIKEFWTMYPAAFSFNKAEAILHKVFNDFEQHIKSLEVQLANTEQLTCKDCSKKLLCEMAQKAKDTLGTKLNEQWFNCFEKDTQ